MPGPAERFHFERLPGRPQAAAISGPVW
jgi:hypothetical protein